MEGQTPPEGYVYPSIDGIKIACLLAVVLTIARFTFERLDKLKTVHVILTLYGSFGC